MKQISIVTNSCVLNNYRSFAALKNKLYGYR